MPVILTETQIVLSVILARMTANSLCFLANETAKVLLATITYVLNVYK